MAAFGRVLYVLCVVSSVAQASPLADPGDLRLRHDLTLLADAGLLHVPLSSWPLSWGDISRGLGSPSDLSGRPADVSAAFERVQRRVREETRTGEFRGHLRAAVANGHPPLRTFGDMPREEAEGGLGVEWTGSRFAFRLQAAGVDDPQDGNEVRGDGSFAGVALGNWMFTAGALDRWWGPGWEGSLVLSTNARPVPAVAIQRNNSYPFETSWLSWIGPWQFIFFAGQLEEDRDVPHAKLLGFRFNFKPVESLEIGLSRAAQWGGEGRPQDLQAFRDFLIGKDNIGQRGLEREREAGNQLAGYDLRWVSPLFELPYALYAQAIAEDRRNNYTPKAHMYQWGLEVWGAAPSLGASYRIHVEMSDTLAAIWSYGYNHGIYTDGYRYYDRSIGHAMDNDGRMWSLGALWVTRGGVGWTVLARRARLNRDGGGLNTVSDVERTVASLELANTIPFGRHTLSWGASAAQTYTEITDSTENSGHWFVQWRTDF